MRIKNLLACCLLFIGLPFSSIAQVKILFDASKAEAAGNADWVLDADLHNLGIGSAGAIAGSGNESNAQRIPTPLQPATGVTVAETYWDGGLSFWGVDCAYKGYTVESLPYNGRITYGDGSNAQDLSNYKAFMVCEPNIQFTAAEKTAMLNFISNGGGLFMIADHDVSDRNNDGWDAPHIWNDFMQANSTGNINPFGIIFDYANFSETSTNVVSGIAADTLLRPAGTTGWGNVTRIKCSGSTSISVSTADNASAKPIIYRSNGSGNTNVVVATARYGAGKIVAVGDSSPFDDGTGDSNDALFTGYNGDVTPNHRNLIMNATIWLVTKDKITYTFNGNGSWSNSSNWLGNKVPPLTLPAGDSIIINPLVNGNCILDVTEHIAAGATLTVNTGKNLLIPGLLSVQ